MPIVLDRDGFHHRATQLTRQSGHVNGQPLRAGHIGHIQRNDQRFAQALEFEHQAQIHAQVGGVHHRHDGVGRRFAFPAAFNHLQHHLLIGRRWRQAVRTRQVHHRKGLAIGQTRGSHFALHRDTGVIGDLLACTGQQVKERGFAAVGVAHQCNAMVIGRQGCLRHGASDSGGSGSLHMDALGFHQTQREQCFPYLHRQRLAATWAAAQHLDRLTGNKPQLPQTPHSGLTDLRRRRLHALDQRVGSVG